MRITGGSLRGRHIPSPIGDLTRPTTDMWRSTMFDALSHVVDLNSMRILDLFAGTGALGFEALSRGAAHGTFVESSRYQVEQIRRLARDLHVDGKCSIAHQDVPRWVESVPRSTTWDVIFADPPYSLRIGNILLRRLGDRGMILRDGIFVYEHGPSEFIDTTPKWERIWSKSKGDTAVDIFRFLGAEP